MSIPVTCPECDYHFQVADEFAGRPGRCPECEVIIQVPDPAVDHDPPSDDHLDPYPYQTPRAVEAFQDEPVPFTRRVRHEPDPPLPPPEVAAVPSERTFDRGKRAKNWNAVAGGFRNLTIAAVLLTLNQVLDTTFLLIDGAEALKDERLDAKDWAMMAANGLLTMLGLILWAVGRIGCGRVPYVPARSIARPAAIVAGCSAALGVLAFAGIIVGIVIAQQNQAGALALLFIGFCSFFPAILGCIIGEFMALTSQLRMAAGLGDSAFARASRLQLTSAVLLTTVSAFGCCGLLIFLMDKAGEQQHAAKQKMRQAREREERERREKEAEIPKGAAKKGVGKAGNADDPEDPEPPPQLADFPELVYGMKIGQLLIVLAYSVVSIACWQLGRAAIRRETERLLGDPHAPDRDRDLDRGWGDDY